MNLSELYRTAAIIDLQHEIMQDALRMAKTVKRWKYRPVKTHRGNMRRFWMLFGFTDNIHTQARRMRMLKSQAAFTQGGEIVLPRLTPESPLAGIHMDKIIIDDLIKKNDNTEN